MERKVLFLCIFLCLCLIHAKEVSNDDISSKDGNSLHSLKTEYTQKRDSLNRLELEAAEMEKKYREKLEEIRMAMNSAQEARKREEAEEEERRRVEAAEEEQRRREEAEEEERRRVEAAEEEQRRREEAEEEERRRVEAAEEEQRRREEAEEEERRRVEAAEEEQRRREEAEEEERRRVEAAEEEQRRREEAEEEERGRVEAAEEEQRRREEAEEEEIMHEDPTEEPERSDDEDSRRKLVVESEENPEEEETVMESEKNQKIGEKLRKKMEILRGNHKKHNSNWQDLQDDEPIDGDEGANDKLGFPTDSEILEKQAEIEEQLRKLRVKLDAESISHQNEEEEEDETLISPYLHGESEDFLRVPSDQIVEFCKKHISVKVDNSMAFDFSGTAVVIIPSTIYTLIFAWKIFRCVKSPKRREKYDMEFTKPVPQPLNPLGNRPSNMPQKGFAGGPSMLPHRTVPAKQSVPPSSNVNSLNQNAAMLNKVEKSETSNDKVIAPHSFQSQSRQGFQPPAQPSFNQDEEDEEVTNIALSSWRKKGAFGV